VGRVVVDEAPARALALEDVGREDGGDREAPAGLRQDVLRAVDPSEVAAHLDTDVGDGEPHLGRALEDGGPGPPDLVPAVESAPARMDAGDVAAVGPHVVHLGEIQALERAVEALVRLLDGLTRVVRHAALLIRGRTGPRRPPDARSRSLGRPRS